MPNLTAATQSSSNDNLGETTWTKLKDLPIGSNYQVANTWQKDGEYGVQVSLRLVSDDGAVIGVNGNTYLTKVLEDSHINNLDEGWRLSIEEHSEYKGNTVVKVKLYCQLLAGSDTPF